MYKRQGQIFETIKANFKLIALFAFTTTAMTIFFEISLNEALENIKVVLSAYENKIDLQTIHEPSILSQILIFIVTVYCYCQLYIISVHYHQQPPHSPRTALWLTDPDFHKNTMRFIWHQFLMILLFVCIILTAGFILAVTALLQAEIVSFIALILFIATIISFTPLTATKLPAVIDPNGDTSLDAAFRRGKYIFWKYLGYMSLMGFISILIMFTFLIPIGLFLKGKLFQNGTFILPDHIDLHTQIIIYSLLFLFNLFNMMACSAYAVITSHYYIWSEYYLPKEESTEI